MLILTDDWNKKPDQNVMNKQEYFKAMSGRRISKIYEQLRLMKNLSNKNNYSYTEEDIEKIETLLHGMVDDTINRLRGKKDFTL